MRAAHALLVLIVLAEGVALFAPGSSRTTFVARPGTALGPPTADAATTHLGATPAGAVFLHQMTADDVARGLWGLRAAGRPAPVDPAAVAAAAAAQDRVLALRTERRAAADRLAASAAALARATR